MGNLALGSIIFLSSFKGFSFLATQDIDLIINSDDNKIFNLSIDDTETYQITKQTFSKNESKIIVEKYFALFYEIDEIDDRYITLPNLNETQSIELEKYALNDIQEYMDIQPGDNEHIETYYPNCFDCSGY